MAVTAVNQGIVCLSYINFCIWISGPLLTLRGDSMASGVDHEPSPWGLDTSEIIKRMIRNKAFLWKIALFMKHFKIVILNLCINKLFKPSFLRLKIWFILLIYEIWKFSFLDFLVLCMVNISIIVTKKISCAISNLVTYSVYWWSNQMKQASRH